MNRSWKPSELKSLMSMFGWMSMPAPSSYSATVVQPPPSVTCTSTCEPRSDEVEQRSNLRVMSSRPLVSAARCAPIGPSRVVSAAIQRQLPEAQLPDETTRTLPFFSSSSSPISVQGPDQSSEPSDPPQLIDVNLSL